MANKAKVGRVSPVRNITDYMRAYPKALVTDQQGRQIKPTISAAGQVSGVTVGGHPIGTGADGQLLEVPKIVPAIASDSLVDMLNGV